MLNEEEKELKAEKAETEKPYEFVLKEKLEEMRKDIKSFDDLTAFLKYVQDHCNSDYGGAPRAIAQASLAVAWYLSSAFDFRKYLGSAAEASEGTYRRRRC